jgi:dGTPase
VVAPPWALAEANSGFDLELASWPGLEAQIAAIADDIAYDNHDIDDGLRAGLFTLDELLTVPIVAARWADVKAGYPGVAIQRLVPELVRDLIGQMVLDVLAETRRRANEAGVASSDDVRQAGRKLADFSQGLREEERALKSFLHARMYDAAPVKAVKDRAQMVLSGLFEFYRSNPDRLPSSWRPDSADPRTVGRAIGDFVAGMTDRYAIRCFEQWVGPAALPEGF